MTLTVVKNTNSTGKINHHSGIVTRAIEIVVLL